MYLLHSYNVNIFLLREGKKPVLTTDMKQVLLKAF